MSKSVQRSERRENNDIIMEIFEHCKKPLNHLNKARRIRGARVNTRKADGPNFHLRYVAEVLQNRFIYEADGY